MITLDCETEAIRGNPIVDPPELCGLAYHMEGHPAGYLHFVGPKSNSKYSIVEDYLHQVWESDEPVLFHNAPFDLSVICDFYNLPMLPWERVHDTMFLVYLADPYALDLGLKSSAERYLNIAPDEQDLLLEWIMTNIPGVTKKTAGAYTAEAPMEILEPYAIGDVTRTRELYDYLIDKVPMEAYNRERQLMPHLVASSRRGVRVHRDALHLATGVAQTALDTADARAGAILGVQSVGPLTPSELASVLQSTGKMNPDKIVYTPTGRVSTAKDNLLVSVEDTELLALLNYRSSLNTCITTFMIPWMEFSDLDNRIHPEWHQVRSTEDGKRFGARTGRMSCSNPNLMNVPTEFNQEIPPDLPDLPYMREFLLPEEGEVWLKRDFSSQELRIAAHFEDGPLAAAYIADPELDPHAMAHSLIVDATGHDYKRKHVKITGFQILYGGGAPAISAGVKCTLQEAAFLKNAWFQAMPGLYQLIQDVTALGRSGESIVTWGGRHYHTEKSVKHPHMDFSYKLVNYLIQGSAADQTKQCIIDWETTQTGASYLAAVHDELNISAPIDNWNEHMEFLQEVMNRPRLDIPMLSEGFYGLNWHEMEKCDGA